MLDKDSTEKIHKIADHYGLHHQLMKTVEELNELSLECAKSWEKRSITVNLISELADVEIMLEQIKYLGKIAESDIDEVKEYKIDRQIRRMSECTNECDIRNLIQVKMKKGVYY